MKLDERRKHILAIIQREGRIRVSAIIEETGFSPATVRRDIVFLTENEIISHSHGYVQYQKPEIVPTQTFSDATLKIAAAAAKLVAPNDTIIMDSGTTTFALAHQIIDASDISVITNSIPIANLFSTAENIQTYITGGYLRVREAALVGDDVINFVEKLRAQKLFLSTTGIRGTEGLTCVTPLQADVKRAFIKAADEVILLADSRKFNRDALRIFSSFDCISTIITDKPLESAALQKHLEQLGIRIILAE